ncbi:MAG: hypothetical protein J6C63_01460 [Lachnospiraceae bacterium]|nr:hypothetical protein [Lachnospiraceae bacterium]
MKKTQGTKGLIIAIVLILIVAGYYYYLSHREVEKTEEVTVSEAQELLLRDLDRNYPPTPKEVVKYFFDITTCLYNESLSEADVEALAMKVQELYDADLVIHNPKEEYFTELKSEIAAFRESNSQILNYSTSSSVDVDYFEEDEGSFARLYGTYYLQVQKSLKSLEEVFILRKDDEGHWKLFGWQPVDNEDTTGTPQ